MTRSKRWLRVLGVVLSSTMLFAACGGDGDTEAEADAGEGSANSGEGNAAEGTGSDAEGNSEGSGSGSGTEGSGSLTGGVTPEGVIEFGEVYTTEIDPAAAPWTLTIPPGSVTSIEFEAAPENAGSASLSSSDFSISLFAEPGGSAVDVPQIITAREGGSSLTLSVSGVPGDVVSFRVDSQLQPDDPAGGDAPDIITDAIPATGTINGLLGGEDQVDYYALDVAAGAVISLTVASDPTDTFGGANASLEYNGQGRSSASAQPGGTEETSLITSADEGGAWYVRVSGSGSYTIDVAVVPQADGGGTGDAGDGPTSAVSVEPGTFAGQMGDNDSTDFYEFDLPEGAAITFTLRNDPTSQRQISARILVNGTEEVRVSAAAGGTESKDIALAGDLSGSAIIEVWGGASTYEIDLAVGQQSDGGSTGDAGGDEGSAVRIEDPGTPWSGQMSTDDRSDFYVLTIDELGPITVTLDVDASADAQFSARVLINGSEQGRANAAAGGTGVIEDVVIEAAGDIVIELWNGRGAYTLTVAPAGA